MRGGIVADFSARGLGLTERGQLRLLGPHLGEPLPVFTLVNSGGAILQGDRVRIDLAVRDGRRLRCTTVGATLLHAGMPSFARVRLRVHGGSYLEWLPGATMPMAGCRHQQRLRIDVEAGCAALVVEVLHAGPLAGGPPAGGGPGLSSCAPTSLSLAVTAAYDARVCFRERAAFRSGAGQWGPFTWLASVLAFGEGWRERTAAQVAERWHGDGYWGAAGLLPGGGISGKLLATDSAVGRRALEDVLTLLRRGAQA